MTLLNQVGGKIAGGLAAAAVVAGGISWYEMGPNARHQIVSAGLRVLAWCAMVLVAPAVTFFAIGWVARMESNKAGAVLVLAYTAIEAGILAWLFSGSLHGPTAAGCFAAALLVAAAYNLLMCDWIAEKLH